jgi:hypothetical protein
VKGVHVAVNSRHHGRDRVEGPKSIVEAITSAYPVVKDVLGKLGVRKLKAQDLMLLATVHNMQVLTDNARALSIIEGSIKGVNDELRKLDEHLKPVLEAAAELLRAEAERRRGRRKRGLHEGLSSLSIIA